MAKVKLTYLAACGQILSSVFCCLRCFQAYFALFLSKSPITSCNNGDRARSWTKYGRTIAACNACRQAQQTVNNEAPLLYQLGAPCCQSRHQVSRSMITVSTEVTHG